MDEGVVEGCENAGDAEDEFTYAKKSVFGRLRLEWLLSNLLGPEDPERCSR